MPFFMTGGVRHAFSPPPTRARSETELQKYHKTPDAFALPGRLALFRTRITNARIQNLFPVSFDTSHCIPTANKKYRYELLTCNLSANVVVICGVFCNGAADG